MIKKEPAKRSDSLRLRQPAAYCLAALLLAQAAHGQIQFEDATAGAGIDYVGQSWGSSWGDFNGDGHPDLWSSNHGAVATLWLNNGDGTFTDIGADVLPDEILNGPVADEHGSGWGDYDNDGDQDIFQVVAGGGQNEPNRMYVNNGGTLVEQALEMALDRPEGRGRTPLWFDYDNNGLLDLMISTATSQGQVVQGPSLHLQNSGGFVDATGAMQLNLDEPTKFVLYTDVHGDAMREAVIGANSRSMRAYGMAALPFTDISIEIGLDPPRGAVDGIAADLTGNLVPDFYMVEGEIGADVVQTDSVTVEAHISPRASEEGISFRTTGSVTIDLHPRFNVQPGIVFIGAGGFHPTDTTFTLEPDDPAVEGMPVYTPGVDIGFFIGYEPAQNTWTIVYSHVNFSARNVLATSTETVTDVTPIGFDPNAQSDPDTYLVRDVVGVYQNEGAARGIAGPSFGRNIGVGDFDNDMDLDLYIVATGPVQNLPNVLYENDGAGNFTAVPDAGGAAGGPEGRGDAVSVADYDSDGHLDVFVTNGKSKPPFEADGPYKLFRNTGNANHWIQLDLEGVVSNRDGIGARIVATAGGTSQLREYGNDMHFRAQNHRRAHFGLADNATVDQLLVEWPSGITQQIDNVPADQLVRLVEPSAPSPLGKPKYVGGVTDGVFVWQDTLDGPYRLRASGGDNVSFRVRLLSQGLIGTVTPVKLGRNDRLAISDYGFDLEVVVNDSENGVDFILAAGAPALLSVEREGVANPRFLKVGAATRPLPPAGWILSAADLPSRPAFTPGEDMGLHVGYGQDGTTLEARWTGDGVAHDGHLVILADEAITQFAPVSLEGNDVVATGANFVDIAGRANTGQDGADVQFAGNPTVGLTYSHDDLFQSHRINAGVALNGMPNASWLPPVQAPLAPRQVDAEDRPLRQILPGGQSQFLRGRSVPAQVR